MSPEIVPTGLEQVDALANLIHPTLPDYVTAASEYVRSAGNPTTNQKKAAQIRLSTALGRVVLSNLRHAVPNLGPTATVGERDVSGALRTARVDVSEMHSLDGLRLAIELKPVNLAVGCAIWNRFGDIRMTAVNSHLKFPFAVVGGILTVPTYEEVVKRDGTAEKRSTIHLISRAIARLERAGGRRTEGDAPHLLEGVGVLVYDPDSTEIDESLPPSDSPLRWNNFVESLATAYIARFE